MPYLSQMLYFSRAAESFEDSAVLQDIVTVSARNNAKASLTGRLATTPDSYVQVLEGPRAALTQAFARIVADPRHDSVRLCHFVPVKQRIFGEWSYSVAVRQPDEALFAARYNDLRSWKSEQFLMCLARTQADDAFSIQCQVYGDHDLIVV